MTVSYSNALHTGSLYSCGGTHTCHELATDRLFRKSCTSGRLVFRIGQSAQQSLHLLKPVERETQQPEAKHVQSQMVARE